MGRVKYDDLVAGVTGLEVHGKKLRINFTYKGARCREVLNLPITKANVKFAANKLATIKHEIVIGTFSYAHHFPDSPALTRFGGSRSNITLWDAYQDFWRLHQPTLKPSTRRGYPFSIEACINILGKDRIVTTLMPKDIEQVRNELHVSLKPNTIITYLARFRQLLRWCERNDLLKDVAKLTGGMRPITTGKNSPADPFEFEEYTRLLEACSHDQQRNMITVAIYTGIRTGELRALAWEDIDLEKGVMVINRNISNKSDYFKLPKTNETRTVDLQPPAIAALRSQMVFTFMRAAMSVCVDMNGRIEQQTIRPVFTPKVTAPQSPHSKEFYTIAGVYKAWASIMRRAGVRYRRFYQLRHTFASWNLTSHGNLAYIAAQMGHKDLEMLQSVYGKWIASASKSEAARIWEQMQSKGLFAPMTPQKKRTIK